MIFVTGGTGMTGARLLFDLAQKGEQVTALKRSNSSTAIFDFYFDANPGLRKFITWTEGDVTDPSSLQIEQNAEVYHCAGLVSFDPADRDELYRVNIGGTENMVNACLDARVRKLVHVSSVASLGRTGEDALYINEESHWENSESNSDYAISKYGGEREVWRGIAEGLKAVIVNPSIILGPGNWNKGSMSLISRVDKGMYFYTRGISGYVDVSDVTQIMIRLMKSDVLSERFILNSENITYLELFAAISRTIGKKPPNVLAKRWMGQALWRYEWLRKQLTGKQPVVTRYSATTAFRKYLYSSDKIRQLLDYRFIPLWDTIDKVTELYLEQKKSAATKTA
jgi:dihydroflavonol-4-reductase